VAGERRAGEVAPARTRFQFQLSILTSFGWGAPFPVSTSDFKLIRKIAHLVLQWCMNSTGSFQLLKSTLVKSPPCLSSSRRRNSSSCSLSTAEEPGRVDVGRRPAGREEAGRAWPFSQLLHE